jgi:metallo-beta-lactamase family protein
MPVLPNLKLCRSAEESMAINLLRGGAIIIAGSGMCNGGRIVHHLKHNITHRECDVIFTGFQAMGTLGRAIVDGREHVRIHGEQFKVNARIHTLGGFSAPATGRPAALARQHQWPAARTGARQAEARVG